MPEFAPFKPVGPSDDLSTELTNEVRPKTDAVITVRVIKSFEYRSMKALVLKGVDLTKETVGGLEDRVRKEVATLPAFKPFRSYAPNLDTIKLYTRAHGAKTTNLIINLDHDDWILNEKDKTLEQVGMENETEVSFFNLEAYKKFQSDPQTKWDETG